MSKKKLIPVFDIRKISTHMGAVPVHNFTLKIFLGFSFDGTEEEAKEKIDEDIESFEKEITEGLIGTGLEYAVDPIGTIDKNNLLIEGEDDYYLIQDQILSQEDRYNFTLEVILYFSFDGTEEEAKEKIDEDAQHFEKIITEGFMGSGLEYAVVANKIYKHHTVEAGNDG